MSSLITIAAVVVMAAVLVLLLAVTGGTNVLFAEHDLTRPARHPRRAPKEG